MVSDSRYAVIPNARLIAGDLETSFADNKLNPLKESGVPTRAPQGLLVVCTV